MTEDTKPNEGPESSCSASRVCYAVRLVQHDGATRMHKKRFGKWADAAQFAESRVTAGKATGFHVITESTWMEDGRKRNPILCWLEGFKLAVSEWFAA